MDRLKVIIGAATMAIMTSCTINDEGEFELTWVFWVILFGIILSAVFSVVSDKNEARKRGISVDQLHEERMQAYEKETMLKGVEVQYLGGYPRWTKPCKVNFSIYGDKLMLVRGTDTLSIGREDIISISNERGAQRSVGKAAAGAIVGGMLTGGLGLIVGGALGARRQDTSEVFITYLYNGVELTLNLRPGKNTDKVYAWINSVFA